MITEEEALAIVATASLFNLIWLEEGQAKAWYLALNRQAPEVTYDLAHEALERLAITRAAQNHNTRITPGDLRLEVKEIFKERIAADRCEYGNLIAPAEVPDGLNPAWLVAANRAIREGVARPDAEVLAFQKIGVDPDKAVEGSNPIDPESKNRLEGMAQNALKPVPGR